MDTFEEFDSKSQIKGEDFTLPFGKYKGKTIAEILKEDPQYLLWFNKNVAIITLEKKVTKKAKRRVKRLRYFDMLDWGMCSEADLY